ncbi:MAG: hydrogenase maturation nickel metallochaperone HypA [Coriobacteriia bacterium]|nr:hydrogenase maturation nickel metallochaperone HypA [Coriobacteriia bacterium]
MHEMGIMSDVLITCENIAREAGKSRITHIALTIGELTDIQDFALEFAFEALAPQTIAKDATLEMTFISPQSRCNACGKVYEHDRFTMLCPECGSFEVVLLSGRELQIDSIEAEDEEEAADDDD